MIVDPGLSNDGIDHTPKSAFKTMGADPVQPIWNIDIFSPYF
jgi:hypothetical protein